MAALLLIDDDPDLLRDQVSHVFPAPAHRVEHAPHGRKEAWNEVAAAIARTLFSLTCVCPTSPASTS